MNQTEQPFHDQEPREPTKEDVSTDSSSSSSSSSVFMSQPLPASRWFDVLQPRNSIPFMRLRLSGGASASTTASSSLRPEEGGEAGRGDTKEQEREDDDGEKRRWKYFLNWLLSDDTRLPKHRLLDVKAANPDDYETYVGSEVWEGETHPGEEADCDQDDEAEQQRVKSQTLAGLVSGSSRAIRHLNVNELRRSPDFGVFIAGDYGTVDDASWASTGRTTHVGSTFELWTVLKASEKILKDLDVQLCEQKHAGRQHVELYLRKLLSVHPGHEFRVFLKLADNNISKLENQDVEKTLPPLVVMGITQRHIDQVFPFLATLSSEQSENMTQSIASQLLSSADLAPLRTYLSSELHAKAKLASSSEREDGKITVLGQVDIFWESDTLPMRIVGCSLVHNSSEPLVVWSSSMNEEDSSSPEQEEEEEDEPSLTDLVFETCHHGQEKQREIFRLFGSYESLKLWSGTEVVVEEVDERKISSRKAEMEVLIAHSMDDLSFDVRQIAGVTGRSGGGASTFGLPQEFTDPSALAAAGLPPEIQQLMLAQAEEAQRKQSENEN